MRDGGGGAGADDGGDGGGLGAGGDVITSCFIDRGITNREALEDAEDEEGGDWDG